MYTYVYICPYMDSVFMHITANTHFAQRFVNPRSLSKHKWNRLTHFEIIWEHRSTPFHRYLKSDSLIWIISCYESQQKWNALNRCFLTCLCTTFWWIFRDRVYVRLRSAVPGSCQTAPKIRSMKKGQIFIQQYMRRGLQGQWNVK